MYWLKLKTLRTSSVKKTVWDAGSTAIAAPKPKSVFPITVSTPLTGSIRTRWAGQQNVFPNRVPEEVSYASWTTPLMRTEPAETMPVTVSTVNSVAAGGEGAEVKLATYREWVAGA